VGRLVVWLLSITAAAAPAITKVEPPSWWAGHSYSTVRVLLRGSGLKDAQVKAERGLEVLESHTNESGTYLFVDVKAHRPGSYTLKVSTHDGSATAPFEVLSPLPPKGRFQGFSSNDLIYMIMPDRFANGDPSNDDPPVSKGLFDRNKPRFYHGGDFQGIIDHLGYLNGLGVSAIWLTPVYDNPNTLSAPGDATGYHGYHAVDFYAVDEHFGTLDKLRELVDKAHQSGIKVILDMVMNHTGAEHPWVKDPPLPNWFHGTPQRHLNETFLIWTLLDPHAGRTMRDPVLDGWFANSLPDLNQDEPEVARYLIQNTLWWIASTGIDGIRADTMPYVPRRFWHDWNAAINKEYPNFKTVGEVFDGDPAVVSFFQGGASRYDGVDSLMDGLFDFPLYGAIRRAFGQAKPVPELAYITAHDSMYSNSDNLVTFLGNHDVSRFLNEPGATIEGLKLAFTYLLSTRGIPMIYYGDEIGMRGGNDPENRKDFPASAFDDSTRTEEEKGLFDYVRKIALLRRETPELRTGKLTQIGVARDVYIYTRGSLIILLNNGAAPVKVDAPAANGTWKNLLDVSINVAVRDGVMAITVPPRSAMIMMQR
jgi:neopullulanase